MPVSAIDAALADRLFALHQAHYDNVHRERFLQDLFEKEWALLFFAGASAAPVGFSTQRCIDITIDDRPVRALFSGDTIIHRDYWGTQELMRVWCRFAGGLKAATVDRPLFWFLISKGYRTYLYLPLFFHRFYPRRDEPTPPFEQRLLDRLCEMRYPDAYAPTTGLIDHAGSHDRMRDEIDATARRRHHPDVAYFLERNPRYHEGVELACIAEIAPANMRGAARREMEQGLHFPLLPNTG